MNYLYNGVELPALPEWDREVYPYAVIISQFQLTKYVYWLYFSEKPITAVDVEGTIYVYTHGKCGHAYTGGTSWSDITYTDYSNDYSEGKPHSNAVWSDHNILNEDGTLYLAASSPIPVTTIDPTSLIQGWLVGRRIAGQRK